MEEIQVQKKIFNESKDEPESKEHDITLVGNAINTDAFDSIVNSGLFTDFKTDTQNHVSSLYIHIKRRNDGPQYRLSYVKMN